MRVVLMAGMALEAEKRLGCSQQAVVGRAMVRMAGEAIIGKVGVLIDKGTLLVHVAAGTQVFDRDSLKIIFLRGTVGFVAIDTGHFPFAYRVTGKLGKLHARVDMAGIAHLVHFLPAHLLLRPLMKLVTVETADITAGMDAAVPVMQVGR